MRSLVASRSRLSARVAVLAVAAAAMAGCSADINRFADNSFLNPITQKPAGDATASAPSGHVDAQALPPPSRPTNVAGTGAASRLVGASAPIRSTAAKPTAYTVASGTHVVAPGETLTSIARLYGKSRVDVARANKIDAHAAVQ